MESIKKEAQIWFSVIVFLLIWVSLLTLTSTPLSINWEAGKKLPDAVTIFVVVRFAFTQWMWRWKMFTYKGWLVRVPDIQGTWAGELESTWENPKTGQRVPPIKSFLVIRQTFSTISCTMFTKEMVSYSRAAQLVRDEQSDAIALSFNYTSTPKAVVRERSAVHDGAADLRVVRIPERMLEGEYWTGRCTTGDIRLRFHSEELLETFPD
jgi:SMODS-associating 2TM, beta-strand rich effector domain